MVTSYSAGTARVSRISLKDCRKIWIDEVRNRPAIIAATSRSGHFVAVPHTANAYVFEIELKHVDGTVAIEIITRERTRLLRWDGAGFPLSQSTLRCLLREFRDIRLWRRVTGGARSLLTDRADRFLRRRFDAGSPPSCIWLIDRCTGSFQMKLLAHSGHSNSAANMCFWR